jgi:hypothetical protein
VGESSSLDSLSYDWIELLEGLEAPGMVKRILRRVLKVIAVFALIGVAGVTVLLTALAVDHRGWTVLPTPTGHCKVGRVTYVWTDEARVNPYAPLAGTKQDLAVWIWYPAASTPSAKPSAYLPAYWRRALEQDDKSEGGAFKGFF